MTAVKRENPSKLSLAMLCVGVGLAALAGCGPSSPSSDSSTPSPSSSPALPTLGNGNKGPTLPMVPFGNQPCQSLSAADLENLKLPSAAPGKSDRAPATLPFDNLCFYRGIHVGYMTQIDYDSNQQGNRSSSKTAPADLPGAFYDQQGGLWFAKNGYYVVVSGSALDEKLAGVINAKL